jgi:hypothetical protein
MSFAAQLYRLGREVDVLVRSEGATNDFGNPTDDHTFDRQVIAARTYPNRNTQTESNAGDLSGDKPVFMVPIGENQPAPPAEKDRIDYDGTVYEVGSHTKYETHVEFFGEPVLHDEE